MSAPTPSLTDLYGVTAPIHRRRMRKGYLVMMIIAVAVLLGATGWTLWRGLDGLVWLAGFSVSPSGQLADPTPATNLVTNQPSGPATLDSTSLEPGAPSTASAGERLRFSATLPGEQLLSIAAETARFRPDATDSWDLYAPTADIAFADGAWLSLTARSGLYNQANQRLSLTGGAEVLHAGGHLMIAEQLDFDLLANHITTDTPLTMTGLWGSVTAAGGRLEDDDLDGNPDRVHLTGPATIQVLGAFLPQEPIP